MKVPAAPVVPAAIVVPTGARARIFVAVIVDVFVAGEENVKVIRGAMVGVDVVARRRAIGE